MGLYKAEWILEEFRNYQVWSDSWLGINKAPNRDVTQFSRVHFKRLMQRISLGVTPQLSVILS